MEFLFADKTKSNKAILDATKLPKYYKIAPLIFNIEINNNAIIVSMPEDMSIKEHNVMSHRIESLIYELLNAAKGNKDCEMSAAKFVRLISSFKNNNHSQVLNFIFPLVY